MSIVIRLALVAVCVRAQPDPRIEVVRRQVEEIGRAIVANNFEKIVDRTHPKVVQMLGGRERMIGVLDKGTQEMRAHGAVFLAVKAGAPSTFTTGGSDLFAIVPTLIEMKVSGGKLISKSCTIGVSSDAGRTWFFVDGGSLDDEKIKLLFPDFPANLHLPLKERPVFEPTH